MSTKANALYTGTGMQSFAEEVVSDVKLSWKEILYMTLIALGEKYLAATIRRLTSSERRSHRIDYFSEKFDAVQMSKPCKTLKKPIFRKYHRQKH